MLSRKNIVEVLLQWGITNPNITDIYLTSLNDRSENAWYINNDMVLKIGANMKGITNHILISKLTATAILSDSFHRIDATGRMKWSDIFQNIIAGYDSVVHLTEEEIKAIPYVIYSIQLIFIAYCEGLDKLQELSITNQKILRWLFENKEILEYKGK